MTQEALVPPNGTAGKSKKTRSPAYPGIDLQEALTKAEIARKNIGKDGANIDTILHHWDFTPKSGMGLVALSALLKFGLMADEGKGDARKAHLTPTALKILLDERPESPERLALIREAALMPTIHKTLWTRYQGALPSDSTLRTYLRTELDFQDRGANELIEEFKKTLVFARLPESGSMSPKAEDKTKPDGEPKMVPPKTFATDSEVETTKKSQDQSRKPEDQTMRTLQIALTNAPWAMVQVPYPMSKEDWAELMSWFEAHASPLTKGAVKPDDAKKHG